MYYNEPKQPEGSVTKYDVQALVSVLHIRQLVNLPYEFELNWEYIFKD